MSERMGGITRIIHRNDPHPDLLKARLKEQQKELPGGEKKFKEGRVKFSKLQWVIIRKCAKNGRECGSYTALLDDIIDIYYGKRSGVRIGKMAAVRRAVRTLDKKKIAKLMPGLVSRVELMPRAIEIAKEHE